MQENKLSKKRMKLMKIVQSYALYYNVVYIIEELEKKLGPSGLASVKINIARYTNDLALLFIRSMLCN